MCHPWVKLPSIFLHVLIFTISLSTEIIYNNTHKSNLKSPSSFLSTWPKEEMGTISLFIFLFTSVLFCLSIMCMWMCVCAVVYNTGSVCAKSIYSQQGHLRCEGYPSCPTKANRQLYWTAMIKKDMGDIWSLQCNGKYIIHNAWEKAVTRCSCILSRKSDRKDKVIGNIVLDCEPFR